MAGSFMEVQRLYVPIWGSGVEYLFRVQVVMTWGGRLQGSRTTKAMWRGLRASDSY